MNESEMNWRNVHCEVKGHGSFVVEAAEDHRLHLKRWTKGVVGYGKMTEVNETDAHGDD